MDAATAQENRRQVSDSPQGTQRRVASPLLSQPAEEGYAPGMESARVGDSGDSTLRSGEEQKSLSPHQFSARSRMVAFSAVRKGTARHTTD